METLCLKCSVIHAHAVLLLCKNHLVVRLCELVVAINDCVLSIKDTIELLKNTDIYGCITGSSMLPDVNFDEWDSIPDIDLFVYYEPQLVDAMGLLMYKHGFEMCGAGEEWKRERARTRGGNKKDFLQTVKLRKGNVIVNITYKYGKTKLTDVLSSFDMSIIMIGYDIRKHVTLDLRKAWPGMVPADEEERWSHDVKVAVPNPLRDQDVDMYGAEMWVRQFDRVIKYWNRGFDTRPMADFYIDLIDGVIEKGQLFATDRSSAAYKDFVETYEPLRDKMVQWLNDKEDC